MHVVFLQDDFPPMSFGGAGISTFELAKGMKDAGHKVSVITTCRKKEDAGEFEYEGLRIFRIHSDYDSKWRAYVSLYNPTVVRQVATVLKNIRPDIAHINNVHFYLSYHCFKIAKKYAKGVVWTARDVMSVHYGKLQTKQYLDHLDPRVHWIDHVHKMKKKWNPFRNTIITWYLQYADRKFAVSHALQEVLARNGIQDVEVIHTGIDLDAWKIFPEAIVEFKKKYALENKKIIFFGGRLDEGKRALTVLETLAKVVTVIPDTMLVIASKEDATAAALRQEAAKLGVANHLILTGWISGDALKAAYHTSHVVLVPSTYFDSLPRIVLEGMAAGKPVLSSNYGGASEAIVNNSTGYLIDPFAPEDMAEKILYILKDSEKADVFGLAGIERMRTHFGLGAYIQKYLTEYQKLLSARSKSTN